MVRPLIWGLALVALGCAGLVASQLTVSLPIVFEASGETIPLAYTEGQDLLGVVASFCKQVCSA